MFCTFHCFGQLPVELQKMVWDAAAAALPVLSIQRFTADFTLAQQNANSNSPPRHLLCFTPHADFIETTSGHRRLSRACRQSRAAVQGHIDCLLSIHYLSMDASGLLVTRQASVPFNPSGHFCISGLGSAIQEVIKEEGVEESFMDQIQGLEDATSPIKNLTIALDPPKDGFNEHKFMHGWNLNVFDEVLLKMPNLKAVSLVSEGILNRRHHLDQEAFDNMHQSVPYIFEVEENVYDLTVPWSTLWPRWVRQRSLFAIATRSRIIEMERPESQYLTSLGLVDDAAKDAWKEKLELDFRAIKE